MPVLGIDYGGQRIGIAWSESEVLATPHSVIANDSQAIERIAALARQWDVRQLVVGIPRRPRSRDGERKFHDFAEALRQRTCKPVVLWDESLSTVEARQRLQQSGRKGGRDQEIDMYAAAVILQSWLDQAGGRSA